MSKSTTWTLPSAGSSSLAERCTSHRRTSPTSAAFLSSPTRKWRRLRWSRGRIPAGRSPPSLTRVGWHELLATDWETAFAFYGELFGWQKADSHTGMMGTYQGFSAGGKTIGGMLTKPATLPLPFWLYYFNTDDVQAAAKRVEAGGGQILYGPTAVPGGAWIVHCTDPQGAIFALLDRRVRKAFVYFDRAASRDPPKSL